jgi:hypothetical protein
MWKLHVIVIAGLWFSSLFFPDASAQTSRTSSSRSANIKAGTLVAVDTSTAIITLKPRTGPQITYRYTDKTHMVIGKKAAEVSAFTPGDPVVVRFRRTSVGPPSLYDLADKASWEWLSRLRRETAAVTVQEISDDLLHATEGADNAAMDYRVTDKTLWAKDGKEAAASDYAPGDAVYVVPRLLSNGNVMAVAIADTKAMAARLKERSMFTLTGTVKAFHAAERSVRLRTKAGDDREITLLADCVVRRAAKEVPLTALRIGQTVTVHIARTEEGERVGKKITIQTKRTAKKPAPKKP